MAKYLVIVESPAKAKTIGKYLGSDYQVKACMGHLRDLPKSVMGIDIENDFEPDYRPIKGKEDLIKDLKKSAKESEMIFLATDPDREGEAISWHLKTLLNLPDEKTKRVTFNEITKKVVTESIANPRDIDQKLVDAQQSRRVLDRIVGYEISPVMWKKIRKGLSAGRVQSAATRMVDDRDREINDFNPQEYWTLDAVLKAEKGEFTAHYYGRNDKKYEPTSREEVQQIRTQLETLPFIVKDVKRADKHRAPSPPFSTSTLQQEASRRLNMTPRRTMAIAQQLYEGIDITGEGTVGLITYMRTDSLRISAEAQADARDFITNNFNKKGENYLPDSPRTYKTKAGAQDAHEAIRPSNVNLTPERVKADLTGEQYRLYKLIWNRFLASQMANAVYDSVSVDVRAGEHAFHASASELKFAGYTAVYEESRDEEKEDKEGKLPALAVGETVDLQSFAQAQHFTQPQPHYTEATLIRAMEEQGIGRPSTYAPTVSTILDRHYVKKDGKYLCITNLGHSVTGWMEEYFSDISNLKFTAGMEKKLDSVEEGATSWKQILRDFYGDFHSDINKAVEGAHVRIEPTVSDELCPICGKNLVEREGKFGQFLACPGYPECTFTMPLVVAMPGHCPKCGGRILKRTGISKKNGKQYIYYCCEYTSRRDGEPNCDFMTWDVPVSDECPVCGKTMFKQSGRGFKRPFCANSECSNFLPEEKRGYYKKADADAAEEKETKKAPAKKTAAKKTATKKTATAKKTTAKKTAAKKTTTTKKTATKKTTKKAKDE